MFSGFAYANLCVSEAMKKDLKRTLGIQYILLFLISCLTYLMLNPTKLTYSSAIILYDRPPGRFKPTTIEKRHNVSCNKLINVNLAAC